MYFFFLDTPSDKYPDNLEKRPFENFATSAKNHHENTLKDEQSKCDNVLAF